MSAWYGMQCGLIDWGEEEEEEEEGGGLLYDN